MGYKNKLKKRIVSSKENPYYPNLHFECIDRQASIYSVRIGLHYRAVGVREGDTMVWFFIGSHEDYNHLL